MAQAWLIALSVNAVLFEGAGLEDIWPWLWPLPLVLLGRGLLVWGSEILSFRGAAAVRQGLRQQLFEHIRALGPVELNRKGHQQDDAQAAGDLANSISDGIESLEGYYARYLPAVSLMSMLPLILLVFIWPADPLSGFVMLVTAPLIPMFMILIGKGAESLNQKHWRQLARMIAHFLDVVQ